MVQGVLTPPPQLFSGPTKKKLKYRYFQEKETTETIRIEIEMLSNWKLKQTHLLYEGVKSVG